MAAHVQHAAAATKLGETRPPAPAAMRWYRMPVGVGVRVRVRVRVGRAGVPQRTDTRARIDRLSLAARALALVHLDEHAYRGGVGL